MLRFQIRQRFLCRYGICGCWIFLFFLSTLSFRYSTSNLLMSVEDVIVISTSFLASLGTLSLLHSAIITRGNLIEVWLRFARILISEAMITPIFILVSFIIYQRQAALAGGRIDFFWDGIIVLLMNPNMYLAIMFKYLFSIEAPSTNHFGATSYEIVDLTTFTSHPNALD